MADYQRVVEFLRDIRQAPLQGVTEEIRVAATDYAKLCEEANDRLRKVSAFLQQGLRSEAIHLSDETPNLLDLVAALDLPDPQVWAEFCANNGLPVPPPLQMDRASQLNEAYAADQPLEHLLSQHRLLALARGPVRERLSLMRQIASVDPNPTWEKDIRVFEKARIRELPAAFYSAVRTKDNAAIAELHHEINETQWYETLPADIQQAVSDAFSRVTRAQVESDLQALVEPLRDAFAARSQKECHALVQRWKNIMSTAGVTSVSHALSDEIKPVISWLNEEEQRLTKIKRFDAACRDFATLLEQDAPDAKLEAGLVKLKEFDDEIPGDLLQRYQERRKQREVASARRHKLTMVTIGGVVVLLAGGLLGGFYMYSQANAAKTWADKIRKATQDRNLALVQQLIDQQDKTAPNLSGDAAIKTAKSEAAALLAEYERDRGVLTGIVADLDSAAKAAQSSVTDANASVDDLLNIAGTLQGAIDKATAAGDLSWVDGEKKLPTALAGVHQLLGQARSRVAGQIQTQIAGLSERVDEAVKLPSDQAYGPLTTLGNTLRAMKDAPGIDESAKSALAAMDQKVAARLAAIQSTREMAGEMQNIRSAVVSSDDLKKALQQFTAKFPDAPQTAEFNEAIKRLNGAKAIEAWRDVQISLNGKFVPATSAVAAKRVEQLTAYLTTYADSPLSPALTTYADYLKRATEGLAERNTWQDKLADLLAAPTVSEISYMEVSDGSTYLVMGDIKKIERKINNQVSVSFQALNLKDLAKRVTITVDAPKTLKTATPVKLPHAKFANLISDEIKTVDENNWDTYGIDLADRIVKDDTMDIVVRAILLQQVLKVNQAVAGWAIGDAYDKTLLDLTRQQVDALPWYDKDRVTDSTRKAIKSIFDNMPSGASIKQKLATAKADLFKQVSFDVIATGVLLKDDLGNWQLHARGGDVQGAVAWTVAPPVAPATHNALVPIGSYSNGKLTLRDSLPRDLPQGSMVFVTR